MKEIPKTAYEFHDTIRNWRTIKGPIYLTTNYGETMSVEQLTLGASRYYILPPP